MLPLLYLAGLLFLFNEAEHCESKDNGYCRKGENRLVAALADAFEEEKREEDSDSRTRHVEGLVYSERLSHMLFVGALRNHHVPGRRADSFAEAVNDPREKYSDPGAGKNERQLIEKPRRVAEKGEGLFSFVFVADVAAENLEKARDALGNSLDYSDEHGRRPESRGEIERNKRIDHLA